MPRHPKDVLITAFKGLNNTGSPENTDQLYLKKANNIDIDKTGNLSKRKGYHRVLTGNITSLWSSSNNLGCYAVLDGNLVGINRDYTTFLVRSNVGTEKISFEEVDDLIYYASPIVSGVISEGTHRDWGIPKNTNSPTLSQTSGQLPAGFYQVNYTWVYKDGRESGCSRASIINLPDSTGISVSIPAAPLANILYARIYCSTQSGSTLYYHGTSSPSSSYIITNTQGLVDPLRFFNIDAPPLGSIVKYYRGRVYLVSGNILWYSEPFQYEQFKLDSNYFEFPEDIREVMPVEDGIWVGSDKLYYLSGEEPERFKRTVKEHCKIVKGTSAYLPGSYLHMDNVPAGYKWLVSSDVGIWILFNQGLCINATSQNVSLKNADSGSAIFLQNDGMNRYMSILKTNENPNNSVFGDTVETTIVRNGITLP